MTLFCEIQYIIPLKYDKIITVYCSTKEIWFERNDKKHDKTLIDIKLFCVYFYIYCHEFVL